MGIGRKIIGGYVVVLVMLLIVVVTGSYTISILNENYRQLINVRERLAQASTQLGAELRDQTANYRGFLLYADQETQFQEALREDQRQFAAVLEGMRKRVTTDEGRRLIDEIAALQLKHEEAQQKVIALAREGKRPEAIAHGIREVRPLTGQLTELVDRFSARQLRLETESEQAVVATIGRLNALRLTVVVLAVLFAAGMGFTLSRSITKQLREGIAQLSSSSAEILAMTSQVASGSAETATAVSETSTTVEEVKQTAQMSLQKARYVAETAQKTSQAAQVGRKALDEAVAGARRIQDQMGSVAESIVRLSEQSQAVGEIIATVNDLADQSNLLAVNAAIEAAKAGEQGRGFGVVAQEVKSLAEQSKQATAQVRAILNDIQKAVSGAVMATEQGSKAVEAGVKQTGEAGEAIRLLTESITEAAQAATQIAASSQQQQAGMDQVALAIGNIHQATAQNVAGTKQAEQAARLLAELGHRLGAMIEGKKGSGAQRGSGAQHG